MCKIDTRVFNKFIKTNGSEIYHQKNVLFRGREQHLDHAAPVESGSPLPGASPISESVQQVVQKTLETCGFLLVCDRLLPFFIPKSYRNPPPRPPREAPF